MYERCNRHAHALCVQVGAGVDEEEHQGRQACVPGSRLGRCQAQQHYAGVIARGPLHAYVHAVAGERRRGAQLAQGVVEGGPVGGEAGGKGLPQASLHLVRRAQHAGRGAAVLDLHQGVEGDCVEGDGHLGGAAGAGRAGHACC